jgi:transketolase
MINKKMFLAENLFSEEIEKNSTRAGFGVGLMEAAKKDKNVAVVTADLMESTQVDEFARQYPERFFDTGVAEQNLMGISAGLALSGKIVFATSFGVFSPGRNWDVLRISVCYNRANVKVVGTHGGIITGEDGASHQALEDLALTRCLPNLKVLMPADFEEARKATGAVAREKGPFYLRLCRPKIAVFTTQKTPFKIGKANVLWEGSEVTVIGCGPILYEAMLAVKELEGKISCEVINCHTIKPMDIETIVMSVRKTKRVVTVEDHQVMGGLGSAVAEVLGEHFPAPMRMVGVRDSFGESGNSEGLKEKYGLTVENIIKEIREVKKCLI